MPTYRVGGMAITFSQHHLTLAACVGGVMGSLIIYGIMQEKLMTRPYGDEKFTDTAFLVLCNRIVAMCVAIFMIKWRKEEMKNAAPIQNFFYVSISNFFATYCQYEALKYVTFPTQTLGKCAKMIPVLIWGTIIYRKSYGLKEYGVATVVMLGCTLFLTTGSISSSKGPEQDSLFGLALVCFYLMADGFTSTFQEKLFHGFTMSTYNQMLYVNLSSAILSIFALLPNGRIFEALAFCARHPDMLREAIILSLAASLGQMVIYYTIREFGALIFSTIMTTRQFVSLLLSSLIFLHPLSLWQWVGTVMVFTALYYQGLTKEHKKDKKKEPAPATQMQDFKGDIEAPPPAYEIANGFEAQDVKVIPARS